MDSVIETWRVEAFNANVYNLSQQKGSRLASLVRNETFTGKAEFFDRLGLAVAQDKLGRNSDTPNLDIPTSRRMVSSVTREWGTLVDRKDKVQQIHDPENEYAQAAMNALGRKMDSVIIAGAFGTAQTGESGAGTQTLGTAQKLASVNGTALDAANLQLLRKASRLLNQAEAVGPRYLVHTADFLEQLLALTPVTSADYNSVKALVQGEIDTYMGFKFIHTELLPLASTVDQDTFKYNVNTGLYSSSGTSLVGTEETALVFVGDGIILGKNPLSMSRIEERADKSYSVQVYTQMDFGAVRMEEAKVLQLIYLAS